MCSFLMTCILSYYYMCSYNFQMVYSCRAVVVHQILVPSPLWEGVPGEVHAIRVLFRHHLPYKCDCPGWYNAFNMKAMGASLTRLAPLFIPLPLSPPSWSELLGRGVGCLFFLEGIRVPTRPPSLGQVVLFVYWAHTIFRECPTAVLSSVPLPQKSYVNFL